MANTRKRLAVWIAIAVMFIGVAGAHALSIGNTKVNPASHTQNVALQMQPKCGGESGFNVPECD